MVTICLAENGSLYGFGSNLFKELLTVKENSYLPVKIDCLENIEFVECGSNHVFCKTIDEDIYCWGLNTNGQLGIKTFLLPIPTKIEGLPPDVVDIKCGDAHTLLLTSSQEVYSCGNNTYNQLGRTIDSTDSSRTGFKKIPIDNIIRMWN